MPGVLPQRKPRKRLQRSGTAPLSGAIGTRLSLRVCVYVCECLGEKVMPNLKRLLKECSQKPRLAGTCMCARTASVRSCTHLQLILPAAAGCTNMRAPAACIVQCCKTRVRTRASAQDTWLLIHLVGRESTRFDGHAVTARKKKHVARAVVNAAPVVYLVVLGVPADRWRSFCNTHHAVPSSCSIVERRPRLRALVYVPRVHCGPAHRAFWRRTAGACVGLVLVLFSLGFFRDARLLCARVFACYFVAQALLHGQGASGHYPAPRESPEQADEPKG
jgi:hypothetical protein